MSNLHAERFLVDDTDLELAIAQLAGRGRLVLYMTCMLGPSPSPSHRSHTAHSSTHSLPRSSLLAPLLLILAPTFPTARCPSRSLDLIPPSPTDQPCHFSGGHTAAKMRSSPSCTRLLLEVPATSMTRDKYVSMICEKHCPRLRGHPLPFDIESFDLLCLSPSRILPSPSCLATMHVP